MIAARRLATSFCLAALCVLAGCAGVRPPGSTAIPPRADSPGPPPPQIPGETPSEAPAEDPMAVFGGDRPLPLAEGALERIDCLSGREDLHARVALEARGGQVTSFAYYSRWSFRTCSISLDQRDTGARWRLTEDGATRVQTPHGSFLIRADADAYRLEFRNVERMKFCGMYGRMSGEMVVRRRTEPPQCETSGILDR